MIFSAYKESNFQSGAHFFEIEYGVGAALVFYAESTGENISEMGFIDFVGRNQLI